MDGLALLESKWNPMWNRARILYLALCIGFCRRRVVILSTTHRKIPDLLIDRRLDPSFDREPPILRFFFSFRDRRPLITYFSPFQSPPHYPTLDPRPRVLSFLLIPASIVVVHPTPARTRTSVLRTHGRRPVTLRSSCAATTGPISSEISYGIHWLHSL